ncbi:phage portal protein [Paenirhodobacter populi]|uniref:Phage portal protein n=1 Tax=Paenirhodobacter populi TaxID=2306993 RepID=A0A443JKW3_9RHOB|nr:phage portal protein [Sinirhodobacter populi]RWR21143.1 phage portal protein [Sinirhodobacter populi]
MGWFSKSRHAPDKGRGEIEQKSVKLTDPAIFELFGITPASSGVSVTAASAMRVPAVKRAVSLISESIATLPFKTYTENKDAAKDHPAYRLVHDWSNDWLSAEALREQLTADALLTGNGYAQVTRNSDSKPLELLRMDPAAVSVDYDDFGEPSYTIRLSDGGEATLPYHDVLHIQALGGVSPVMLAREAIGLCLAAEKHLSGFFANGGRPSGVIKHPEKLTPEALKKISASWFRDHGGDQAGKTAILDEGMDFKEVALKLADAEFSEVRREQVREIARAFNVPPALLYELSRGTWSNFEQSHRDFLTGTLRPWIARWQAAYTRVLLTPEERASFYIEAVVDDMQSVEFAARATAYSQYRGMGAMTANEVRAGLNLTPLPEGNELANPFTTTSGGAPAPAAPEEPKDE